MSGCIRKSTLYLMLFSLVLCTCSTSLATISFSNNTLTYSSPSDLGTTIDPSGQKTVAVSYGVSKASFQALSPQVVAFNSAPAASQTLRTLVATYKTGGTVTFTFPAAMYNYGSVTTYGRGSFSGSNARHAISTVPSVSDSLNDWLDATITTTGGQGVESLGFCAAFRTDQAVPAGQVLFTLSDATTGTVTLPALGGSGNPQLVFIGYTAPAGKTITRVRASRAGTVGGAWVSIDDLAFKMSSLPTVTLSRNNASIAEAGGVCTLTATLSATSSQAVTVNLGYSGTATSGTDYTGANSITVNAGNLTGTTNITATQDTLYEGNETVVVDISSVTNGTESGTQQVSTSITDDDSQPSVTLSRNNATIAEAAGVSTLTATLSNTSTQNVTVNLGYTGTATGGGADYTAASSITVTAGNLTGTTNITAVQDSSVEGNETIIVDISSVTNGTESGTQQVTVTITDDDSGGGSTIVALKRNSGLDTSGAIDSRFTTATVRTVTVSDAFLYNFSDIRYGNGGGIGSDPASSHQLYKFDLSSIPAGSTINLAQLRLYHGGGNIGGLGVGMILTHDWTQGTGTGGGSYPGAAGGVSFAHPNGHNTAPNQNSSGGTTPPLQSWGPGSDSFFSMSTDVGTIQTPSSEPIGVGYHVINVTAHVQAWVNGTSPNYGWAQETGNWAWVLSEGSSAQQPVLFVDYGSATDTTAPAVVSNLATSSPTSNSITLSWTAPGDDGSTGTASSYDIRYRTGGAVDDTNWATATQCSGEPTPLAAGNSQNFVVSGLSAGTTYYFAIKTSDEVPNVSALSNVPSGTTSAPVQTIVALKRDSGLDTSGAIDSRFTTATVRTVTVSDAFLYNFSDIRYGNGGGIGSDPASSHQLYKFDLSSIPAGSTINLAQLRLYHSNGNIGGLGVGMILTHDWTQGTGTGGGSYPGAAGGVSFAHPNGHNTAANQNSSGGTTPPLQSWGPGSDSFFSMSTDVGTIQPPSSEPAGTGHHVINVTAHVQAWVNGTSPNYGWAQETGNWGWVLSEAGSTQQPVLFVDYGSATDTTAPAVVSNLATNSPTSNSITLSWTAPGDDGSTGTASSYDIRYRIGGAVDDTNWATATQCSGEPTPLAAGNSQNFVVGGLSASTTYYFAIKTSDEVPNTSAVSNSPSGTTTSGGGKTLLTPRDFKYKGYYVIDNASGTFDMIDWGQGLTHRYVDGQLRFLTISYKVDGTNPLIEYAPPAGGLGGTISTRTNYWPDIWTGTGLPTAGSGTLWHGLWYEEAQNRLWTTWAVNYPGDDEAVFTKSLAIRTLNSNGTVSNVQGPWGLQGIQQRRIYGGVQAIPSWFQSTYGVGPYATGWGGCASRAAVGPISLGPTFYTFAEPTGYPVGDLPTSAFKTLMDHSEATLAADWYAQGFPTTYDRGVRNCDLRHEEGPDWQAPAPDGLGRWTVTGGDSNYGTGTWIETPTKQGFILIPLFPSGRVWYQSSSPHHERKTAEIQVFDLNMLGQVAQGTRAAWNTYPTYRWQITDDFLPLGYGHGGSGNLPHSAPSAATYDPTTQTLYVLCLWGPTSTSHILVYEVGNGNASVSDVALAEAAVTGTVSGFGTGVTGYPGNRANTETADSVYETVQEVLLSNTSQLEHKWTFNVTAGSSVVFNLKSYKTSNTESDNFVFAYSTNGTNWTNMVTVSRTTDDGTFQTYTMPGGTSGTVYVRVQDTDRTAGRNNLDTIYVDRMFFSSAP